MVDDEAGGPGRRGRGLAAPEPAGAPLMDAKNLFETPATYRLIRLEYALGLVVAAVLFFATSTRSAGFRRSGCSSTST